ncbi:flagellin [Pukyongiella litopenaei]|uniref:Flagellar biosynthesis protein FlgL n=1 Tax=Pukyongiella litopenaei TaxID=2605946 RepID=A0A2S0MSX3_9RHOB|nr:flagellin [Pukyongiella litopenaei]AVO38841.1 flagellar biosynthesis protein FlgL [Pukyongiella litopenaei]
MTVTSIGDLAQSLVLRSRVTQIKTEITTLTGELASGQTADLTGRLGNDLSHLTDIDRNLTRLRGFAIAAKEAQLFAAMAQESLGLLQNATGPLANTLLQATSTNVAEVRQQASVQARVDLETAISALNGQVAGRSVFAGTATDRMPLLTADDLLAELRMVVAGQGTATDVAQAAAAWFDDPAGFTATIYQGAATPLAAFQVGPGQSVTLPVRADDAVLRDLLKDLAIAALADDPALALDAAEQTELYRRTGEGLIAGQDRLTGMRAELGYSEARIEAVLVRNTSEQNSYQLARNALAQADPFETAARLEEVQVQLEALYAVTVRTSNLTLLNFLK